MLIRISNRWVTHIWFYLFVLVLLDFSLPYLSPQQHCSDWGASLILTILLPFAFSLALLTAELSCPFPALSCPPNWQLPHSHLQSAQWSLWSSLPSGFGHVVSHSHQHPMSRSLVLFSTPLFLSYWSHFCLDLWPEWPSSRPGVIHVLLVQRRAFPLFPAALHQCLPLYEDQYIGGVVIKPESMDVLQGAVPELYHRSFWFWDGCYGECETSLTDSRVGS